MSGVGEATKGSVHVVIGRLSVVSVTVRSELPAAGDFTVTNATPVRALKYVRRRSVRENPILSHAQHKLRIRCATGALNAPGGAVACMEHADPLVAHTSACGASRSVP